MSLSIDDGLALVREIGGADRWLRDIYHAAGGEHPDLAEYDRAMVADRRTAVLIMPTRITSNPPGTEHKEHTK